MRIYVSSAAGKRVHEHSEHFPEEQRQKNQSSFSKNLHTGCIQFQTDIGRRDLCIDMMEGK